MEQKIVGVGLDLAKNVTQVHAIAADGTSADSAQAAQDRSYPLHR